MVSSFIAAIMKWRILEYGIYWSDVYWNRQSNEYFQKLLSISIYLAMPHINICRCVYVDRLLTKPQKHPNMQQILIFTPQSACFYFD